MNQAYRFILVFILTFLFFGAVLVLGHSIATVAQNPILMGFGTITIFTILTTVLWHYVYDAGY